jgi:hypothetical protein
MGFDDVKQLDQEARSRYGEIVFRFYLGSIYQLQHFNADAHPGNYVLLPDGRVAFLDFGMTKRLDVEQIRLEEEVVKARIDRDPERLREKLHELGFLRDPKRIDAEQLMQHVDAVGGWYLEDVEREVTPEYVMNVISAMSDPRSDFYALMRRENVPANEPRGDRRARRARPAAGEAELAPDRPRVVVRGRSGDGARAARARILGGPRRACLTTLAGAA